MLKALAWTLETVTFLAMIGIVIKYELDPFYGFSFPMIFALYSLGIIFVISSIILIRLIFHPKEEQIR